MLAVARQRLGALLVDHGQRGAVQLRAQLREAGIERFGGLAVDRHEHLGVAGPEPRFPVLGRVLADVPERARARRHAVAELRWERVERGLREPEGTPGPRT